MSTTDINLNDWLLRVRLLLLSFLVPLCSLGLAFIGRNLETADFPRAAHIAEGLGAFVCFSGSMAMIVAAKGEGRLWPRIVAATIALMLAYSYFQSLLILDLSFSRSLPPVVAGGGLVVGGFLVIFSGAPQASNRRTEPASPKQSESS